MDLNALRQFVAVVQAGSLSKAGERLRVPVPTLSRKMVELEKSLSMQLLDRTKAGVKPTAMGQRLYEQVYESMDNLLQVEQFGQAHAELSGLLRVSTISASEPIWDLIGAFQAAHPQVQVHCQITDRVLDLVADGMDVAFRVGDLHTDNVIARPLMQASVKFVAHPDLLARFGTPQTPEDLSHFPCAGWAMTGQKYLRWQFGRQEIRIPYTFASNDAYAIAHLVKQGKALAMVDAAMAQRLMQERGLVEVLADAPRPTFPIHLIYLAHRHPSSLVKAFVEFCLQHHQQA